MELYKYELACREARLTEEKTKDIRRMFDADYKRLKRRKQRQKKENFYWISINAGYGPDDETDFADIAPTEPVAADPSKAAYAIARKNR